MSTLQVENLIGPTSGSNANKVIIPSGQTLDASNGFIPPAGTIVQHVYLERSSDLSSNSNTMIDVNNLSITPKYADSLLEFQVDYSFGRQVNQNIRWNIYDVAANSTLFQTGQHMHSGLGTDADPSRHSFMHYTPANNTNTRQYRLRGQNVTGSGVVWWHTYASQTRSYFIIREVKQ
jgi:hypothetical protein